MIVYMLRHSLYFISLFIPKVSNQGHVNKVRLFFSCLAELEIFNVNVSRICSSLKVIFSALQIPLLIPGLNYAFETLINCISDKGISDKIRVSITILNPHLFIRNLVLDSLKFKKLLELQEKR